MMVVEEDNGDDEYDDCCVDGVGGGGGGGCDVDDGGGGDAIRDMKQVTNNWFNGSIPWLRIVPGHNDILLFCFATKLTVDIKCNISVPWGLF